MHHSWGVVLLAKGLLLRLPLRKAVRRVKGVVVFDNAWRRVVEEEGVSGGRVVNRRSVQGKHQFWKRFSWPRHNRQVLLSQHVVGEVA